MATATLEFDSPEGLTLTTELYAYGLDALIDDAAATENTNDKGCYTAAIVDVATGSYKLRVRNAANVTIARGILHHTNAAGVEHPQWDLSNTTVRGHVLQATTIATLASQTSFTLTEGSADNDSYNDCPVVIEDSTTAAQKCVGIIKDYIGATKTVTLLVDPAIFTMAVGDKLTILASDPALRYIAASAAGLVSGAGTGTELLKSLDQTTTRLTATVDASGNRTAITYG